MKYTITADTSGHGLPIGSIVTSLDTSDAPDWSDDGVEWYTQGGEGDEVAIEAIDIVPTVQHRLDVETAYMRGMDDGVADYCQEVGGDGSDHGTCVLP